MKTRKFIKKYYDDFCLHIHDGQRRPVHSYLNKLRNKGNEFAKTCAENNIMLCKEVLDMILFLIAIKGTPITETTDLVKDGALDKLQNFYDNDIKIGINDFVEMYYHHDQDLEYSLNQLHRLRGLSHMMDSLFKHEVGRHKEISLLEMRNHFYSTVDFNYSNFDDEEDEILVGDTEGLPHGRFIKSYLIENLSFDDELRRYGRFVHVIDMRRNDVVVKTKTAMMPFQTAYAFMDNPLIWSSDSLFESTGYDKKLADMLKAFKCERQKFTYPKDINVVVLSEYEKQKRIIDSIT